MYFECGIGSSPAPNSDCSRVNNHDSIVRARRWKNTQACKFLVDRLRSREPRTRELVICLACASRVVLRITTSHSHASAQAAATRPLERPPLGLEQCGYPPTNHAARQRDLSVPMR